MFNDLFDDVLKDILDIEDDKRTDDITQYVAFVLDRSSSMLSIKEAAISAFNEQLDTLRKESGSDINTLVTVTQFNEAVELGETKPLPTIEMLTEDTYQPGGMTALYDAIGETTIQVAKRYREDKSDAAVLFVVVTDGTVPSSPN
jgi:Mg-chelatase subunit ChlD